MKKALFSIALLIAGALLAWHLAAGNAARIEVVKLAHGPAVQAVYATGTVEPTVMIPIAPRQAARLMDLQADEGQKVTKDQILAQLEDTDLAQTLAASQSKADLAQKQFDRVSTLYKRNAISKENLDQAKADLEAANADVAQVEAQLSYLKLLAPADGTIIRRDGEVGQMIPSNEPVFWMTCCKPLRIASEVDEEDISLVQPGQSVAVSADAFPGKIFKGKVESITPKGDPVARSYRVRITMDEETPLMIGMTAETNIVVSESKDALLAPAGAVANGKIWTIENGALHQVLVETGAKSANAIEIKNGLKEDAVVVKDAAQSSLEEGKKIGVVMRSWQSH